VLLTTTDAANPGTGVMRRQSLPLIMVAPTQITLAHVGVPFSSGTAIGANGGTPPYSFSATNLPAGLSIASATGVISGTPTAQGLYAVTVTVTDAASNVSSATYNMAVEGTITPQFASGSAPGYYGDYTAQLPPATMVGSNSTIYVAATALGDYTGAGIDWSMTCTYQGTPISDCNQVFGQYGGLYNPNDYTTHSDSFGTAGSYNTIMELDTYGFQAGMIVTLTATSTEEPTKSVSASITMVSQTPTVTIQGVKTHNNSVPSYMVVNKSVQLVASVSNDPLNAGVTWSASCGTLSNEYTLTPYNVYSFYATFTAPASVPAGGSCTITASSITDSTAIAQASIPIDPKLPADGLINGNYVLLAKGLDTNGYLLTLAGTIVGDGNGNIYDGNVFASDAPADYGNELTYPVTLNSSTYNFGTDGRGTLTLAGGSAWSSGYGAAGSMGVNGNITFSVTFVTSTHALINESDGFGNASGTLDFQNASDLAAFQVYYPGTGLNGTYSLVASGAQSNPENQFFLGSAMTFTFTPDSGHGGITTETSAVGDESINGVVTANTSATSLPVTMNRTYMKPDDYGHMFDGEYDYGVQVGPTSVYMDAYMIDASHFAVIGVTSDGKNNFAGYLVAEPASPTLSGTYGFIENGASASTPSKPLAVGGIFTCGATGVLDVAGAGTATTNQPINAACANPTAGRGTIAISGAGSTNVSRFAAYPTVDSTLQLIELDGGSAGTSGPVGSGVAYPQTATSPTASVFDGSYGADFVNYGSTDDLGFVGLLSADGLSALAGTVDVNTFQVSPATATPTAGAAALGSFNADTNGRFTGSLTEPASINGAFYVLSNSDILLLETDSSTPGTGALELQQLPQLQ
jgi:hypothetical protein